jgi:CheY-like chemotaxis protein
MSVRCLIVDDNRDFLRVASDLLDQSGISVVGVASTAAQASQARSELQPDVVLVDIGLGEESGFDVARQLGGQTGADQLCVILISAHSREDYVDMLADTPGVSFLPKNALSAPAVLGILAGTRGSPRHLRREQTR